MITVDLLKDLLNTNSPIERLRAVLNHCKELDSNELEDINSFITSSLEEKSRQGKLYASKRKYSNIKSNSKNKTYKNFLYVNDYKSSQNCVTCGCVISSNKAFRRLVEGEYHDCHAIPSCFPEDNKFQMINDKKYIADMEIKNEK
jgi:hypothetical protein